LLPAQAVPRRLRESLALAEIGRAVSESERLEGLYEQIATSVRELLPADRVVLVLVAPETGELYGEFVSEAAGGAPRAGSRELLGERYILDEIRVSGDPARFDDVQSVLNGFSGMANAVSPGIRSGIYAPLVVRGSVIGILGADGREHAAYSDDDLDLLVRIANQIAGSVASAQLQQAMERETRERELLAEIGRAASSTLDMDQVLDRVFEKLNRLVPADRVSIGVLSESTGSLGFAYTSGVVIPPLPGRTAPHPSADGLPALVVNAGTSRIINDLSEVLDEAPGAARPIEVGLNSAILVPLISGDETIGVFAVNASDRHSYTTHDLDLMERLAPHLTGAIINARLHAEVDTRAREEAMLAEVGLVVTSSPEFGDVIDSLVELISNVIRFDRITIVSIDEATGISNTRFVSGIPVEGFVPGDSHVIPARALETTRKIGNVEVMDSTALHDVDSARTENPARAAGLRTGMSANLMSRGVIVGNLSVRSKNPDAYGPRDVELLRRVSVQIAGAFANSELHQQLERRAREETLLAEVSRAVSSSPDFGDVFDTVVDLISQLIDFDRFAMTKIDVETQLAHTRFVFGTAVEGFAPGDSFKLNGELFDAGYFDTRGSYFEVGELEEQVGYTAERLASAAGLRSGVGVNLRSRGRLIGNLSFRSRFSGAYDARDLDLLVRIGDQLAGAFANWELLLEVERRAGEDSVLAKIGRKISSLFDPDTVLELIMDDLREIVNVDRSVISLANRDTGLLEFSFVSGKPLESEGRGSKSDSLPNGISERVVSTGAPVVIGDIPAFIDRISGVDELQSAGFKSAISVPLIWDDKAIGAFGFASEQFETYDDRTVDFIRRVSGMLTGWMMNVQLRSRLERQAQVNAVIAAIGRDSGSSLDLNLSMANVVPKLRELMTVDRLALGVIDTGSDRLRVVYNAGIGSDGIAGTDDILLPSDGLTSRVFHTGESVRSNNIEELVDEIPGVQIILNDGLNSTIVVPLLWERETVGILGIAATERGAYQPADLEIVERAAQLLAGAVVNAALHDRVERRAREETVLSHIGRVVNSSVSLDEVYGPFAELAGRLVPSDRIVITTLDDREHFVARYVSGSALPGREPGERIPLEGSLTEICLSSGETVSWSKSAFPDNYWADCPALRPVLDSGIRAILAIPLSVQNVMFGTLFFTTSEDRAYSEHETSLGEAVADQIAGGISGASLREDASRRAIEESMLSDVYEVISSSLDLGDVFPGFAKKLALLLPTDKVEVNAIDHESGEWVDQYDWHAETLPDGFFTRGPMPGSATEVAATTREAFVLGDSSSDGRSLTDFPGMVPAYEAGIRSTAVAPMMSGSDVFGALFVHSTESDAFTEDQINVVRRVALMLASAVSNATLLKQSEMSARERTVLAEIAQMAGSTLDVESLYENAAAPLNRLVPYDRMSIATFDTEAGTWRTAFVAGAELNDVDQGGSQTTATETSKYIAETRRPLLLRHPADYGGRFIDNRGFKAGMKSLILVPVIWADQVIAVIALHSQTEYAYGHHELRLAEEAASQIAGAITNAKLHARVDQQAREQALLARIGRVISSASSLDGVFEQFTELVLELIPAGRVEITSRAHVAADELVRRIATSGPEVPGRGDHDIIPVEGSMTEHVMDSGAVFVWPDPGNTDEPEPGIPGLVPALKAGLSSIISVPLQVLDRSIGVLHLSNLDGRRFSAKDVELGEAVADQIAGALANADLFAQTEREARERTVLAEISKIIGSSFDLKRIHIEVSEHVRSLLSYDRMSLVKVDRELDTLVSLHTVGLQVPAWAEGKEQPLSGSVAEYVTETRAGVLVAVETPQEFVDRFPAQAPVVEFMELRSLIAAPLIRDGDVFGVLHLSSETPGAYSESDLHLAERIASQIAGGVINADLFARSEEYAREREQLAEIGRIVGSTLELDDLWTRIIDPIKKLITYDRFAVVLLDQDSGDRWTALGDGAELMRAESGAIWNEGANSVRIWDSGNPILIDDVRTDDRNAGYMWAAEVATGFRSKVGVPVTFNAELVGEIDIKSFRPDAFTAQDVERLEAIAGLIAGAVANARLHAAITRGAEEEKTLSEIGRMASSSLEFGTAFDEFADSVGRLIPFDRFVVMGLDPDARILRTHFVAGREVAGWEAGTSHVISGWQQGDQLLPPGGVADRVG